MNDKFTYIDLIKILGCMAFFLLLSIAMAFIFIWIIQGMLSVVGWMIWGV